MSYCVNTLSLLSLRFVGQVNKLVEALKKTILITDPGMEGRYTALR